MRTIHLFIVLFMVVFVTASNAHYAKPNSLMEQKHDATDTVFVADSLWMSEIVINAIKLPVTISGDTVIYNVASFTANEADFLRNILKRIPGFKVSNEGVVTINGQEVNKLMLNGKEFFGSNMLLALENIPAHILDVLKVYEQSTNLYEQTGIQTDPKEKVLDMTTKDDYNKGWFAQVLGGAGQHQRFQTKADVGWFNDVWQNMFSASYHNAPHNFDIGGDVYDLIQKSSTTNNSVDSKIQDYNFIANQKTEHWDNHVTLTYTEDQSNYNISNLNTSFLDGDNSYTSESQKSKYSTRDIGLNTSLIWNDSLTTLAFVPSIYYSEGRDETENMSMTWLGDLSFLTSKTKDGANLGISKLLNDEKYYSQSIEKEFSVDSKVLFSRILSPKGRYLRVKWLFKYNHTSASEWSDARVHYYQLNHDELALRRNEEPSKEISNNLSFYYEEPLSKKWEVGLLYNYIYDSSNQKSLVYDFSHPLHFNQSPHNVLDFNSLYADSLSRKGNNAVHTNKVRLVLQYQDSTKILTFGLLALNQHLTTHYAKLGREIDTICNRFNVSPTLDFSIKFSPHYNFAAKYIFTSRHPSIEQLLPIVDNSDPLSKTVGNQGLNPTNTHSLNTFLAYSQPEKYKELSLNLSFNVIENDILMSMSYNQATGGQLYRYENVDGNWQSALELNYNTTLFGMSDFSLSTFTNASYLHRISLQTSSYDFEQPQQNSMMRYVSNDINVQQTLSLSYTFGECTLEPYGFYLFDGQYSKLQDERRFHHFGYGITCRYSASEAWNFDIDIFRRSRRGFIDNYAQKDETVCNAALSFSFLKNKVAVLRLVANDIFHQISPFSTSYSSTGSCDVHYNNSVNSYYMLTFSYKLNHFGS